MKQINANTHRIKNMLGQLRKGEKIFEVINQNYLPDHVSDFLNFTFQTINEGKTHKIASVFTFGREDLIPDMFISMIKKMNRVNDQQIDQVIYYFERHIEIDGDEHGPMAIEMIKNLCGKDSIKWDESISAAQEALQKRIGLWDGINHQINKKEKVKI